MTDALRFSRLKLLAKSPMHYAKYRDRDTASLRQGLAVHSFLLGGEGIITYRDGARNEKHEKYREFLKENPGKLVLSPAEYDNACGMRDALRGHPEAMRLLDGEKERTRFLDAFGRRIRGTPDVVQYFDGYLGLTELKTSRTSHHERFKWEVRKHAYHSQMSWYRHILEKQEGMRVEQAKIVAVESTYPWPVTVFNALPEDLDLGWRSCRRWLELLQVCEQNNHWPGYAEADVDLGLTADDEVELDFGDDEETAA